MASLGTPLLGLVFLVAAAATWTAGVFLSKSTDSLDTRLGLGDALGGIVLLAIAGSLPEVAITASAALSGHLDLAVGNLIGGIAIQTIVLAMLDLTVKGRRPLSFLVGSLVPVLEALMVVAILATALGGTALPSSTSVGGVSPASIAIVALWLGGVWIVDRARLHPAWDAHAPESRPGRRHPREPHPSGQHPYAKASTAAVALVFGAASAVTLGAGVALQESGSVLADRMGLQGAIFGATVLAAVTALPEVSSGIAAVRLGDHQLAMGDILGGNSFQLCLFLLADLLAGRPALAAAHASDVWLGALGLLLSGVVAVAVIARPHRRFARLGADSIAIVALYGLGVALLPSVT